MLVRNIIYTLIQNETYFPIETMYCYENYIAMYALLHLRTSESHAMLYIYKYILYSAPINDFCAIIAYYVFMWIVCNCSGGVNVTSIIHTNYIVIKC